MAQISYLKKRGSTYYAQQAVPLDLQEILGAKTREKSLRTKDPREAKRLLRPVLDSWEKEFDEIRRQTAITQEQRQPLTAAQLAMRLYRSEMLFDDELRATDDRYARFEIDPVAAQPYRDGFSGKLSNDELQRLVGIHMERYRRQGLSVATRGSDEWRAQAQALCVSLYEGLARTAERNDGDFTGTPSHPILVNVDPEPEVAQAGDRILELYDRYAKENARGITADTLTQARRDVKLFVDTIGDIPAGKLDKKAVRTWKGLLLDYPVKAAEISAFRGMTMREIIKANEKLQKPKITNRTVNRYLSSLGAFCDWLVRNDYLDQNPVEGLHQAVEKHKRSTRPFTVEQMNTLFASPLFTGCQNDDDWHKAGNHLIRDHRYWLPLVMLYSGARPAEVAQLTVEDVRDDKGTWIIHITESDDDDQTVKTKGSMRVVPLHSELIKLGFVDYRNAAKARGEPRLFPAAVRNQRGQMAADFSRDFGRYLTRIGLKKGRGLSLYSFRHGFVDALRRAEYLDEQFGFLVGHTSHTMTGQYGQLPQGMLRQRVEMIEKVTYSGLDIEHLKAKTGY